jgi:hypothetical protein
MCHNRLKIPIAAQRLSSHVLTYMIGCACKSWLESWCRSVLSSPKSCQSLFFMIGHVRSLVTAEPASFACSQLPSRRVTWPDAPSHHDHLFLSLHAVRPYTWLTKQACSHTLPLFGLECMQCLSIFTLLKVHAMSAHKTPSLSMQYMCALHSL